MDRIGGDKKTVARNACTSCRKRKLKCDGKSPCSRCIKLKTPEHCSYVTDRRKDKRTVKDGSRMFVFKNHVVNNQEKVGCAVEEHVTRTVIGDSIVELQNGMENSVVELERGREVLVSDEIRNPLPVDLNFENFQFQGSDFDNFLKLLGDNQFSQEEKSELSSEISQEFPLHHNFPPLNGVDGKITIPDITETMHHTKHDFQRHHLIDILFEDKSHTPPGISKQYLLELESRYEDLEKDGERSDEKFLLATVLCLGALTMRKRELLRQPASDSSLLNSENGISLSATNAHRYYNIARRLIPQVTLKPSVDSFCGFALMSNFMTIMISLEGQLYLSMNALQIAIELGITMKERAEGFMRTKSQGVGLILLFWNVWCSFCMLTTFLGRDPFLMLTEITTPLPREIAFGSIDDELSLSFMQLRIHLADIQTRIFRELYVNGMNNKLQFDNFEREIVRVTNEINRLRSYPLFDRELFFRNRLLILELSSFRAQTCFLLYRPYLESKHSLQAVTAAQCIIHEIWGRYTKKNPENKRAITNHLDWNFCYPLRTASLTLWTACLILLRYKKSANFLQGKNLFEFTLALEVLDCLVQLLPIHQDLVNLIKNIDSIHEDKRLYKSDDSYFFWTSMFL